MLPSHCDVANLKLPRALRIAYVLPIYWPALGGCELHTRELAKRLAERHVVNVITILNRHEDKRTGDYWFDSILQASHRFQTYKDNTVTIIKLPLKRYEKCWVFPLVRIQSPKVPPIMRELAMKRLIAFYRRRLDQVIGECDIIHSIHGGVSYFEYAAYQLAKKRGVPFVYTSILHLFQPGWRQEMEACRKSQQPFVYQPQLQLMARGPTDFYWYRLCFEADAVITMTEMERELFIDRGIHANKIFKVGVGPLVSVNISGDFRQKYRLQDQKIVLFLGRNHESKGIEELLTAAPLVWAKAPDTHFVFVGPLEGKSREIFSRHRDPKIVMIGAVSDAEKSAVLAACDILCVPSLEESLGGVYLEAWYYKKPIIAADIPPLRELTDNGKGGFLVDLEPTAIAAKIIRLLGDGELRDQMGSWGQHKVLTAYNWDTLARKTEAIYVKLVNDQVTHEAR